jgi:hypothetical protein
MERSAIRVICRSTKLVLSAERSPCQLCLSRISLRSIRATEILHCGPWLDRRASPVTLFQKWGATTMKQLRIGDITIDAVIEREGPWRRPQDFFPTYDGVQASYRRYGAGGI